jgi:hypothetical protein
MINLNSKSNTWSNHYNNNQGTRYRFTLVAKVILNDYYECFYKVCYPVNICIPTTQRNYDESDFETVICGSLKIISELNECPYINK